MGYEMKISMENALLEVFPELKGKTLSGKIDKLVELGLMHLQIKPGDKVYDIGNNFLQTVTITSVEHTVRAEPDKCSWVAIGFDELGNKEHYIISDFDPEEGYAFFDRNEALEQLRANGGFIPEVE